MFTSVIIPVLNGEKYIRKCFDNICGLKTQISDYEVILADNGSTDQTHIIAQEYLSKFALRIIVKPGVKVSALRNYAAHQAQGEILAFLDVDCIAGEEWLNKGREAIINGNTMIYSRQPVGMSGAPYRIPFDYGWVAKAWNLNSSNMQVKGEIEWLPGGNIFVRRDVFWSINGFDESLTSNEDYDLCYRLRERGFSLFSDPRIEAVHLGTPQTLRDFFKKEMWHGKDVFRIFLESGTKLKNLKAVMYGLNYLMIFLTLSIGIGVGIVMHNFLVCSLSVFWFFCLPLLLSFKTSWQTRKYRYLVGLAILYLIYGIARAACIIRFITRDD